MEVGDREMEVGDREMEQELWLGDVVPCSVVRRRRAYTERCRRRAATPGEAYQGNGGLGVSCVFCVLVCKIKTPLWVIRCV